MADRVHTTFTVNQANVQAMLHADNGPVGRDMRRRGNRVLARAKELVGISTGRLYNSLKLRQITVRGRPAVTVSTDVPYARFHHDGTGIYGSRGTPIRPRQARALRFKPRGSSQFVFAASVRGSRPNPFLLEALPAAADQSLIARARSLINRLSNRNGAPAAGVVAGRDAAKIPGSGPRPQRATSTRRRRQQPARRSGWQSQVSGGRSGAGSQSGASRAGSPAQPSTGGWQRNVSGGRSRTRDTGWVRDVGPGRPAG